MTHAPSGPSRRGLPLPVVPLVVLVALGATACGGSSTPTATPSSAGAAPSSTPAATASSTSTAPTSASGSPKVAPVPVETRPPGDIPDNLAFVRYSNAPGGYSFTYPEGWARTGTGTRVRFTDKLNGVTVDSAPADATSAPTVASVRAQDVVRLRSTIPAFELRSVASVTLPAGPGVRLVFRRNSDPDPVTGKVYRDEVEEYAVQAHGHLVRMDLFGPVGADNVDAYRTMSQSLVLR